MHKPIALALLAACTIACSDNSGSPVTQVHTGEEPTADNYQFPADGHKVVIDGKELTFQDQMLYLIITLNIYRTHIGNYPSTQNNLDALISSPAILEGTGTWQGPYADTGDLFIDPWGRKILYEVDDQGVLDLRSLGEDGVKSKDDLNAKEMFPDVFKEMEKLAEVGPIPIQDATGAE